MPSHHIRRAVYTRRAVPMGTGGRHIFLKDEKYLCAKNSLYVFWSRRTAKETSKTHWRKILFSLI